MNPRIPLLLGALAGLTTHCSPGPTADSGTRPDTVADASAGSAADSGTDFDAGTPDDDEAPDAGAYSPSQWGDVRELDGLSLPGAIGGRSLPVLVRYSGEAPQPLPVVIWEHGGTFNPVGHRLAVEWSITLAKAGYLVVHAAHVPPTAQQLADICADVGVSSSAECVDLSLAPGAIDDESAANVFSSVAVVRPSDVQRLLDGLPALAARLAPRGVRFDADRVAVAGWSGGSQAPLQLAGAARFVSASLPHYTVTDPRPIAFVAISPQGPGYSGFYATAGVESSWDEVRGPMLVATGDHDEKPANTLTGPIRALAYEHMPPGEKYLWYSHIEDAAIGHATFGLDDLTSTDPQVAALSVALSAVVVGFLDAHVKQEPAARAWLSSSAPAGPIPGLIEWTHK